MWSLFWGKPAQQKEKLIDTSKHLVIKSPHPSPLSAFRGFFGSKPYSRTNDYLQSKGKAPSIGAKVKVIGNE